VSFWTSARDSRLQRPPHEAAVARVGRFQQKAEWLTRRA